MKCSYNSLFLLIITRYHALILPIAIYTKQILLTPMTCALRLRGGALNIWHQYTVWTSPETLTCRSYYLLFAIFPFFIYFFLNIIYIFFPCRNYYLILAIPLSLFRFLFFFLVIINTFSLFLCLPSNVRHILGKSGYEERNKSIRILFLKQ